MRKLLAAAAAALALAVTALAIPGPGGTAPAHAAASELVETTFGCTVILRSTGPSLLADAGHHCDPEFTDAYVDAAGTLTITYAPVAKVISVDLTIDESITSPANGPSVGLDHMWFRFRNSAGTVIRADGAGVACGSCNIFIRVWALVPAPAEPSPSPTP